MRVCSSSFYFYYNFNLKCNFLVPTNNNNFALSLSLSLYYALNFSLTYTIFANILALTLKYKCSYCNNVKSFCSLDSVQLSSHIYFILYDQQRVKDKAQCHIYVRKLLLHIYTWLISNLHTLISYLYRG